MEIIKLPLADLEMNVGQVPDLPKNPRQWTHSEVDSLARSIKETPELYEARALLVFPYQGKYVILGGNLRYEASKVLKLKEVPVIVFPAATPVSKLKEIVIKDNGSFGDWDYDALGNLWDDLPLTEWGVPAWEADAECDEKDLQEIEEDDFDEGKDEIPPRSQKGDIWLLGNHRLMCGDSTNQNDVLLLTEDKKIDLVFTDPPYGVSYVGINNPNGKEWDMIENDDLRGDALYAFLCAAFSCLANSLKEDGAFYVWFASVNHIQFEKALNNAGLRVKQELIWDKGMVLGHSDYHWAYEPCLYGAHIEGNCKWYGDRKQKTFLALNRTKIRELKKEQMEDILLNLYEGRTCWKIDRDNVREYVHPTQKPVELAARAMRNSCTVGQSVLDLFGGSGTTIIAAEQMDRICYMMEYDPHYCDVIIARWEKFTGKQAEKV